MAVGGRGGELERARDWGTCEKSERRLLVLHLSLAHGNDKSFALPGIRLLLLLLLLRILHTCVLLTIMFFSVS